MKINLLSTILMSGLILVSCSGLVENTRKSLLGDDKPRAKPTTEAKWVSKAQYDDLMQKYRDLNEKYESIKMQSFDADARATTGTNPTETVDVFGKNGLIEKSEKKVAPIKPSPKTSNPKINIVNTTSIGEDLDYYKKAVTLKENNKLDESLKIFQFLEKSKSKQIRVRAKRHIGDIYFSKNQYDLSLQVYEDLIRNHAFSGSTIKALGKAALSAEKLGLMDKKAQYESLLNDVFDTQV